VANLNYPEGFLPPGRELVHSFKVKHWSEHGVANLKRLTMDEPLVVAFQILLIVGDAEVGVSSPFIKEVDVITPDLVLCNFVIGHNMQRGG
jgi:hypothetical protein